MSTRRRPPHDALLEVVRQAHDRFVFLAETWALPREDAARFARLSKAAASLAKELRDLAVDSQQVHALSLLSRALTPRTMLTFEEGSPLDATLRLFDRVGSELDAICEAYRVQIKPLSKSKLDPRLAGFCVELRSAWLSGVGTEPTASDLIHALGIAVSRMSPCPAVVVDLHGQPGQVRAVIKRLSEDGL